MLLFALATSAFAEGPDYAVMIPRRPATLPKNDVAITVMGQVGLQDPLSADALVGAGLGITDQLEIGAWLLPLGLAPAPVVYRDPSLYVKYGGALSKTVTLSPLLRLFVPVSSTSSTMLDAQADLAVDLGDSARLSIAPSATLHFVDAGPNTGFGAPVSFTIQPDRRFFVALQTGVGTDPFSWQFQAVRPDSGFQYVVPAGLQLGGTVGRPKTGAVTDLSAGVFWPALLTDAGFNADGITVVAKVTTNLLSDSKGKGKGKGKGKINK
jgi:hypothetical protein